MTPADLSLFSPQMLARADRRGGYDDLVQGELTGFMSMQPGQFDLIVSADTLCHFGDLTAVCRAAAGALRAGGYLVVSVEEEREPVDFPINPQRRYSPHIGQFLAALARAGLAAEDIVNAVLRHEAGSPVLGLVVTGHRPNAASLNGVGHPA